MTAPSTIRRRACRASMPATTRAPTTATTWLPSLRCSSGAACHPQKSPMDCARGPEPLTDGPALELADLIVRLQRRIAEAARRPPEGGG
jgi:hypothetical protein